MELRHLRYFVAVAEEGSFTRAAERLGIKQPPLSLQIRQLEMELGTPLFRRLTRRIELTGAGVLLLEEARNILEHVEQTKTDVKRRARGETGKIWIGSAGATYFEPTATAILREYCLQYPNVVLFAEGNSTFMLVARVHSGKIDAAFVWSPFAEREDLVMEPVAEQRLVVMLPRSHALCRLPSVPLAALASERFLLFARRMNVVMYDRIIAACRRAGFQPNLGREMPDIFAAFPFVAAERGISLVPECMTRVDVEGVSFLPIEGDAPRWELSLVHRRNDHSAAVKNLVALVRRLARPGGQLKKIAQPATA